LFFAGHQSFALVKLYPEILLLDCTYKTNDFGLPFLVVVGVTGMYTSFYASFCFLKSEKEEEFVWALEQLADVLDISPGVLLTDRDLALMNTLRQVFPHSKNFLCQWHIKKCVQARCTKELPAPAQSVAPSTATPRGSNSTSSQPQVNEQQVRTLTSTDFLSD
jgi:hypothetical protein